MRKGEWEVLITSIRPFPTINIQVNDSIIWRNQDDVPHTVTGTTAGYVWDSDIVLPGESFFYNFTKFGSFFYQCSIHPSVMTGVVHVKFIRLITLYFHLFTFFKKKVQKRQENIFPDVKFSSIEDEEPLPGFSFTQIEGVTTQFEATPGVFNWAEGFVPAPLALPPSYFESPVNYYYEGQRDNPASYQLPLCSLIAFLLFILV